jgi:UDP-N-acetylmuramoylalanine--D-glutamate ligase
VRLADLKGRSVAVWGTGPQARAAVRVLAACETSRLLAVSSAAAWESVPWSGEPAPLAGGDHAFPALVTADVVVLSAEVPADHPWLAELHTRGVTVTNGGTFWLADNAAQAILVTGGEARAFTATLIAHLLTALGSESGEYVVQLPPADCGELTRAPRVAVVTSSGEHDDVVGLLRRGPELIVVDGTDLGLRDAIRGLTDLNGFPPVPAAADDSRFRVEDGQIFCSDDPLFPRSTLRSADEADALALCVALAVLDGVGLDVPGSRDDLRAALASFPR